MPVLSMHEAIHRSVAKLCWFSSVAAAAIITHDQSFWNLSLKKGNPIPRVAKTVAVLSAPLTG
jgi:hypothetical protein